MSLIPEASLETGKAEALEQIVHLLQHLLDTLTDLIALLVEVAELGLGDGGGGSLGLKLLAKALDLGFGGGTCFALALDDLDCAENLLLERLELVDADGGGCAHVSSSLAN
jgi:hypothetical protein